MFFCSGEQRAEGSGRPGPGDEDNAGDWLASQRRNHTWCLH